MATAKQLPSGNWRVRVYDYTDAKGKQHYRSFTGRTQREAEKAANKYDRSVNKDVADLTLGECIERYIGQRTPILSASTVREYDSYKRRYLEDISNTKVARLTQEDVQNLVNKLISDELSPKTVRNVHGFITTVLSVYRPNFALHTALPKKYPPNIYVPTETEIQRLMAHVEGTVLELPVLLAAFGPMRRGEICALRAENISGNIVHVCENMVLNKDNEWVIKKPKSYAGDRYIEYPDFVAERWKGRSDRIVGLKPSQISDHFANVLEKIELPHFRFHDLRHYSASIQHALGVPDAYIMQRGGWQNDGVLKQVYRHALEDKSKEMNKKINEHFKKLNASKHDTKHDTK